MMAMPSTLLGVRGARGDGKRKRRRLHVLNKRFSREGELFKDFDSKPAQLVGNERVRALEASEETRKVRKAKKIIANASLHSNQPKTLSRAVQALMQQLRSAKLDRDLLTKLEALHPGPVEGSVIPDLPAGTPKLVIVDEEVLGRCLYAMATGAASSLSGWTAEKLIPIWKHPSGEGRAAISNMVMHLNNGNFTEGARALVLASLLIALGKPNGGVRPIAMVEFLYKLTGNYLLKEHKAVLKEEFKEVQLAVGTEGGGEAAVHAIRAAVQGGHRAIIIDDDLPNAYNLRDRARLLSILFSRPALEPFFRLSETSYSAESHLYVVENDRVAWVHPSLRGVKQGDPIALLLFAISVQECFEKANIEGVTAVAVCDDLEIVGEMEPAFRAYDAVVSAQVAEGIDRESDKRRVIWIHNEEPPRALRVACAERGLKLVAGAAKQDGSGWKGAIATVLGAPISANKDDIDEWMAKRVFSHLPLFEALKNKELGVQNAMTILRLCAAPRLNYLTRVVPPSDLKQGAQAFDELVLESIERALHLRLPRDNEGVVRTDSDVVHQLRSAVRHAGFGYRSVEFVSPIAFFAANRQALNHIEPFKNFLAAHHAARAQDRLNTTAADQFVALEESHSHIVTAALPDHPVENAAGVLQKGGIVEEFEQFAEFYDVPTSKGAQSKITKVIEDKLYKQRLARANQETKARWKSQTVKGAGAWKVNMPYNNAVRFRDAEYIGATHFSLGERQAGRPLKDCPLCNEPEIHQDHALTCPACRKVLRSLPHDGNENFIAGTYKNVCHLPVTQQPRYEKQGKRTDIRVFLPGEVDKEIDIVTVLPTAASHIGASAQNAAAHAANKAAQQKVDKHAENCLANGVRFVPFAVESYGAIQDEAKMEIEELAEFVADAQPEVFTRRSAIKYVTQGVSTAIQKGNAQAFMLFNKYVGDKERSYRSPVKWGPNSPPLPDVGVSYPHAAAIRARKQLPAPVSSSSSSHSSALPLAVDASFISKECKKMDLTVMPIDGSGNCLPLALKAVVEDAELSMNGAPFTNSQDVRNRVADHVEASINEKDYKKLFHFFPEWEDHEQAQEFVEEEAQQFITEARMDKIHVDDRFVKIFGDLVVAKMEIYKCNGGTLKIDVFHFNKQLTNFEEAEDMEWVPPSQDDEFAKRVLRVAFVQSKRSAESVANFKANFPDLEPSDFIGHYDWVKGSVDPAIAGALN